MKATVSDRIRMLMREGFPQNQAVAVAMKEYRAGRLIKNRPRSKKKNPAAPSSRVRIREQYGDEYDDAARLFEDFTGHPAEPWKKVSVPVTPKVVICIGECDGVLYTTVRDGRKESYIHKFRAADRPLLLVSPKGDRIMLHGGHYTFTERGIVDKSDPSY